MTNAQIDEILRKNAEDKDLAANRFRWVIRNSPNQFIEGMIKALEGAGGLFWDHNAGVLEINVFNTPLPDEATKSEIVRLCKEAGWTVTEIKDDLWVRNIPTAHLPGMDWWPIAWKCVETPFVKIALRRI